MSNDTAKVIDLLRKNRNNDEKLIDVVNNFYGKKHNPREINKLAKKILREYTRESDENRIDYFESYENLVKSLYGRKTGVCLDDIITAEAEAILTELSNTKPPRKRVSSKTEQPQTLL